MVGEDQVTAATLDVEREPQVLQRDRRALDVPAGPAPSEGAVPRRLVGSLGAPQDAVEWILLPGPLRVTPALGEHGQHLIPGPAGHLPIGGVGRHREVEVVVDAVDRSRVVQAPDQVEHERDRLHGPDVVVGWEDAERGHVLAKQLGLAFGELDPVGTDLGRAFQQRVIDIGHVLHVADVVAGGAPGTHEQVEPDVGGGVAEVGGVVRRDPADVEPGRSCRARPRPSRRWRCRGPAPAGRSPGAGAHPEQSTHAWLEGYPGRSERRPRDRGPVTSRQREPSGRQQPGQRRPISTAHGVEQVEQVVLEPSGQGGQRPSSPRPPPRRAARPPSPRGPCGAWGPGGT